MGHSHAIYGAIAVCLSALALAWPLAGDSAQLAAAGDRVAYATAALGMAAGVVATGIAWTSRERPPAFMALGCLSIALAIVGDLALNDGSGTLAVPSAPLLVGLTVAGACFAMAMLSADPEMLVEWPDSRLVLAGGIVAAAGLCVLVAVAPSIPAEPLQLSTGLATVGFAGAAIGSARAWSLIRLPSHLAISAASAVLGLAALAIAGGGLPGVAAWHLEAASVAALATVAVALVHEHMYRPGLRTLVLSLALPGAAHSMSRGQPGPMHALLDAVQDYDDSLRGHVNRVAAIAVRIGMRMRLNASHLSEIALAAQLHDIGKIAIPRQVLSKPSGLSPQEFETMKRHASIGRRIVARIPELAVAARGVGEHHERWDGAGYPNGRAGAAISLTARIVAVADVYDALVSRRVYKSAWTREDALAEILRGAGSHFDPRVVDELVVVLAITERAPTVVAA